MNQITAMNQSTQSARDVRIDALRGLFLVVMTVDHLQSSLSQFTYEVVGYVTAAEGFVFMSGLVAGRVYQRYWLREGTPSLWRRVLRRSARIYSYQISAFLILFSLAAFVGLRTVYLELWTPLFTDRPGWAVALGLMLAYQPHLLDILPMYCVFILVVPLLVQSSPRGRWAILLASASIWLAAQFGVWEYCESLLSSHAPVLFGTFNIFAWQFIFIIGAVAGLHPRDSVTLRPLTRKGLSAICAALTIVLFLSRHQIFVAGNLIDRIESLTAVETLGPARLVNFLALAWLLSQAFTWPTANVWNAALAYLGRHSLQVFTFHIFLIYLLFGVIAGLHADAADFAVIGCVLSLFVPAWISENQRLLRSWLQIKIADTRIP